MTASPPTDHRAPPTFVLLVEEDVELRSLAARLLEHAGCVVLQAESGHDALARLRDVTEIDALVTALTMSDIDGVTLALRARARSSALATVLVTPDPFMVGDRTRRWLDAEVVPKPFIREQLRGALSTAVARRRARG